METTSDLNDSLHAQAKSGAARLHIPLTRFIEQALRGQLKAAAVTPPSSKPIVLPVFRLGLKPAYHGISLNRIYDQLEAETQHDSAPRQHSDPCS